MSDLAEGRVVQEDTDDDDLDWARLREWAQRDDPTDYAVMLKSNVIELFAAVDAAKDWLRCLSAGDGGPHVPLCGRCPGCKVYQRLDGLR